MSTDYEFRCVQCADFFSQDNWRQPEQLEKLIELAQHFAAIGKAVKDANIWLQGWDGHGSIFPGAFYFFAEHEGHDVRVFDEYGRDWSRRDEMCECGHVYYDHLSSYSADGLSTCAVSSGPHCGPHTFKAQTSRGA